MELILGGSFIALISALVTGVVVWLALGNRVAALSERLHARDEKIAELNTQAQDVAQAQQQVAKLEATLQEERRAAADKIALLSDAQARLSDAFKALSSEALKSNNEAFLNLAKTTLEKFQDGARHELEKRQTAIDQMVQPVRETLQKFELKIGEVEKARIEAYSGLQQQVRGLSEANQKLAQALGTPQVRGRWGEVQLRRVVELAGMLEHCDFQQQVNAKTETGVQRPDLVVRLPGGKSVVVDAKTPDMAFREAMAAADEPTRKAKLKEHARSIREHMNQLGKKAYWEQFQPAPEFVILFLPGESFYHAALEQEPDLIEQEIGKNRVMLATPTTLIALLHAFAYGWRQEALAANSQIISELGRELYERITVFSGHLTKLGTGLRGAIDSYNKAMASYESRVLVSARKFQELKATTTGDDLESPEQVDVIPRQLADVEKASDRLL